MGDELRERFLRERERMVRSDLRGRGITDPGVLEVMGKVRREDFVVENYLSQAYSDGPLPIGCGQTISQPYIVALMTQELRVNQFCEVLEIGTGCGYQTAILAKLSKRVYTIERFDELSGRAQTVLAKTGVVNVEFCVGDGSCGWPGEKRKFDRVMVTAAVPEIPRPLAEQLKEGGFIVAPVGMGGAQELMAGQKRKGKLQLRNVCDVRFVRLIGKFGFGE